MGCSALYYNSTSHRNVYKHTKYKSLTNHIRTKYNSTHANSIRQLHQYTHGLCPFNPIYNWYVSIILIPNGLYPYTPIPPLLHHPLRGSRAGGGAGKILKRCGWGVIQLVFYWASQSLVFACIYEQNHPLGGSGDPEACRGVLKLEKNVNFSLWAARGQEQII